MNPEDFKFKFKDIDLKDFYESKIDYDFLKKYIKDFDWNLPNNISTTAVKSSFSDMDVIIGMDHSGQMHIIKNERGEEGVKTININIIMRMFIQALRTGIMKFASNDKFKIFSEAIEKDLENAIMNIVNKYDLNRPERLPKWEKKSPLKFYEP
jgi:replicative DNA helicase